MPEKYFLCIIQYLYSDKFFYEESEATIEFFLSLLVFADYFLLPNLVQQCSYFVAKMISLPNVLASLLVSHAHNAQALEEFCINYICVHVPNIEQTPEWLEFVTLGSV